MKNKDQKGESIINRNTSILPASFRDPSGFLFQCNGVLYRQISHVYCENYDQLMKSGLYDHLSKKGLLIEHSEMDNAFFRNQDAYKVICPEKVNFISYPYEWCFSQLKDAALLTLTIQRIAMEYDMSIKDASAYNIQFYQGRPVMIDTLSFERYVEGQAWVAYRQFCQHFLAPLALMSHKDVRLNKLFLAHIDGIPLDLASRLLPRSTWFKPGMGVHLHIHAKTQKAYSESVSSSKDKKQNTRPVSKMGLTGIVQGLRKTVKKLNCHFGKTEWADYYDSTNYSETAFEEKKRIVEKYLKMVNPYSVWDLGSNTGEFSRIASEADIPTVSFDIDPAAVDFNYCQVRDRQEKNLLPLLLDLTNPSPGLGWSGRERDCLFTRGPTDCIMALALVHHLSISNNVPLARVASFLAELCNFLIVEFVPKDDSQVQRLLSFREDIFTGYDQDGFESEFSKFFEIKESENIKDSKRRLYMMKKKVK
jgi:ribosomal protein L11 methylase PrmA